MKNTHLLLHRILLITIVLGILSLFCLLIYYLALTDIWHAAGSPDFWQGEGASSFEWQILGYAYIPMALFNLGLVVLSFVLLYYCSRLNDNPH